MAKKASRAQNKKSISNAKKKCIQKNKLAKKGYLGKEARKKRRLDRRKEKRRSYFENLENAKLLQEKKASEQEITGEEMMEMIDEDDLDVLAGSHSKDRIKKKEMGIEDLQERRTFKEYEEEKEAYEDDSLKSLLPVMTEKGWEERKTEITIGNNDLLLSKFRRNAAKVAPKTEENEEEGDSGISDEEGDIEMPDDSESESDEDEKDRKKEISVVEVMAKRQRILEEKKVNMACLAMNLVKDPSKLSNLRNLISMLADCDPLQEVTARRYLCMTLLQVFHDLIPGYKMQENALNQKLKKDTYQVARQEVDFVTFYRRYLQHLEDPLEALKKTPDNIGLNMLGETCIHCLGDLLVRHPHFNYSANIIQALVPHLNHRNDKIRKLTLEILSKTIKQDVSCGLTLEIVRKVYKLTQRKKFKVKTEVFQVFLSIRVKDMKNDDNVNFERKTNNQALSHKDRLIRKLTKQAMVKPSGKQKKEMKKMAKIRNQMEDINSKKLANVQNTRHAEIVKTIFGLYFHVLKKKPGSKLMSIVLESLAKFSHMISLEFFSDLLIVMNEFLEKRTLRTRDSIFCIQTVFAILSGQGEALNLDPHRFYKQFYTILLETSASQKREIAETVLDIIEQMLILRRKKVSTSKVLAFAKRLSSYALTLTHDTAIPFLVTLKRIFSTFSATEVLLDVDPEGTPGVFLPENEDPEHANAAATAVWELALCASHYHPCIRSLSKNILSGTPIVESPSVHALSKRSASDLLNSYDLSKLKFNPAIPAPVIHLRRNKAPQSKRVFQDDVLDLDNPKLQTICDRVLEPPQNMFSKGSEHPGYPPSKRMKNEVVDDLNDFDIYKSIFSTGTDISKNSSTARTDIKNFLSSLVCDK